MPWVDDWKLQELQKQIHTIQEAVIADAQEKQQVIAQQLLENIRLRQELEAVKAERDELQWMLDGLNK